MSYNTPDQMDTQQEVCQLRNEAAALKNENDLLKPSSSDKMQRSESSKNDLLCSIRSQSLSCAYLPSYEKRCRARH
jgi:hypothetical protein